MNLLVISGIKKVVISNRDFANLVCNKSKEMYLKNLDTDYGFVKKHYEEDRTIEDPITNEEELEKFLFKYELAQFKSKEISDVRTYFEERNSFYASTCPGYPGWGAQDPNYNRDHIVKHSELKDEDISYIKDYVGKISGFYSKTFIEQYLILTEIVRKKYLPESYYTLENITQDTLKASTNKFGKTEMFGDYNDEITLQDDEIEKILSLIMKAIFLTNKKKFDNIIDVIDTTEFDIKFIRGNKNGNITNARIVNRLRNAFTHYRVLYNKEISNGDRIDDIENVEDIIDNTSRFDSEEQEDVLKTSMLVYDADDEDKLTLLANTTMLQFLEFALQETLIQKVSETTKNRDESSIENIGEAETNLIYVEKILSDHQYFKYIDANSRKNKDLIMFALLCDPNNIEHVDESAFETDIDFLKECIDISLDVFAKLKGYHSNEEIFNYALKQSGTAILYCNKNFYTKENIIKAIENLKNNGYLYAISTVTCNIPDDYFYDYEFAKKFTILRRDPIFLHMKKYREIYSRLMQDEEVIASLNSYFFENEFSDEVKNNPEILEKRRKYQIEQEEKEIENSRRRKREIEEKDTRRYEIYAKFKELAETEKLQRIALRANRTGVMNEGSILLSAIKTKDEDEIGDDND